MNEQDLKQKFKALLKHDFVIFEEVPGCHLVEEKKVKIDFLIKPKTHLIDQGFDESWIGIEVKFLKDYKLGKFSELAWQSVSYSQSIFFIDEEKIRPLFIAMHSNLSFNIQNNKSIPEYLEGLIGFLEYSNVGWFEFDSKYGWRFGFGTHGYFNKKYGKNKIKNMGVKRNVGNQSR